MDWTSVFSEDGDEDIIIPQLMEERERRGAPRLARFVSQEFHHRGRSRQVLHHHDSDIHEYGSEGWAVEDDSFVDGGGDHRLLELASIDYTNESTGRYSLRSMYFLSINFILGVGILGVPYSFSRAGFLLCLVLLLTVTLFSYMSVMWVAETGARFEAHMSETKPMEAIPLIADTASTQHTCDVLDITYRYEVIDLVDYFLGTFQKGLYQIALLALMYIGLVSFVTRCLVLYGIHLNVSHPYCLVPSTHHLSWHTPKYFATQWQQFFGLPWGSLKSFSGL